MFAEDTSRGLNRRDTDTEGSGHSQGGRKDKHRLRNRPLTLPRFGSPKQLLAGTPRAYTTTYGPLAYKERKNDNDNITARDNKKQIRIKNSETDDQPPKTVPVLEKTQTHSGT